jgi:hypothetical protein
MPSTDEQARWYQESTVQNWFSIETEAGHRQFDRKRELAAEAKIALAHRTASGPRRPRLPGVCPSGLTAPWLALPRWLLTSMIAARQRRTCESAAGD